MKYSKIVTDILDNVEKSLTSIDFYWQSLFLVSCVILVMLCHKLFVKVFLVKKEKIEHFAYIIDRYCIPLFSPILLILFLSIGASIFSHISDDVFLFQATIQVVILFVFLRFLKILYGGSLAYSLVSFFLIPAVFLNIFGFLDIIITFLDSFSLLIGNIRISIYTVIRASIVLSLVLWIFSAISKKIKNYFNNRLDLEDSTKGIIAKIIDVVFYFTIFIAIFRVFGIDMTAFAVVGGAVGVGIGFGLQKIASNFISGIILIFEKSVEVGDLVELDGGNIYGTVIGLRGRYVIIEGYDGKEIMVPNEDFVTNKVINWTHSNRRGRVDINVGVSYDSDLKKVKDIMTQCASQHERCLKSPEPFCFVSEFADSSVNLSIHFWVADVTLGRFGPKSDVMIDIFDKFKENNISIPFPQRDVFIKNKNSF